MRSFLIHKNVNVYPSPRRRIGKERALRITNTAEIILDIEIFFLIRFLAVGGLALFWTFLVFLKVTSFLKHLWGVDWRKPPTNSGKKTWLGGCIVNSNQPFEQTE
jgi:hypothetical protein